MELKPGYKQTEVGVIPEDWEVKTLGSLITLQRGHDLTWRDRREGDVPIMGSAGPNGFHDTALAKGPGVTLGRSGASFGQAHYCDQDFWPHNTALYVTDFKGNNPLYVFYLLRATDFSTHNSGGAQQSLNRNFIAPVHIRVPPSKEQCRLAEALRDIDALINELETLHSKKRNIKQAAMQELLTGKRRLPGFEGEWGVKKLGEIAEVTMGQSPSSYNYNKQARGLPLIQGNADIKNRETAPRTFTTQITKRGFNGDILMTVRAPVGEVSKANIDVCLGRGVCAIRFPNNFLYHFLVFLEPAWAKHSKGSTFDSVNGADIKAVYIHLPCESSEQNAIADVLSEMDAELAALEARRDKTRELKQGMMQELLTGRIRLQ